MSFVENDHHAHRMLIIQFHSFFNHRNDRNLIVNGIEKHIGIQTHLFY